MQLNHLEKRYLAVVHGHLQKEEGTIDLPIFKPEDEESIFKRIIDERGQRSITHYKVVERLNDADLVEGNVMTEYEEKFSSQGNPICKLIARLK